MPLTLLCLQEAERFPPHWRKTGLAIVRHVSCLPTFCCCWGFWGIKAKEVVLLTLQLKHRPSYGVLASLLARIRPNAKLSGRKKLSGHGGPSGSSARQVFMEESQASLALGPGQPLSCPESILHPTPFLQRIDK